MAATHNSSTQRPERERERCKGSREGWLARLGRICELVKEPASRDAVESDGGRVCVCVCSVTWERAGWMLKALSMDAKG